MAFTVSMPAPSNHLYHVEFRVGGLKGPTQDFKMCVWTPGYYSFVDFASKVQNFEAKDISGATLKWDKPTNYVWRVQTGGAAAVAVSYDISATTSFVGNCFLDDKRGYITPGGVFMHVGNIINHPVTVTIVPNPNWNKISTGLDPVAPDQPHTYLAPDFDILYDSPILMGNLESFPQFEIQGVPHNFVAYNPGQGDYAQFMQDLKAVVGAGIAVFGDVPYTHYTFHSINAGRGGGIEHLNTASVSFSGSGLDTHRGRNGSLDFLAHEYFHNFNVKRIRPIELGPFDYDHGSRTKMLWVSEGLTSYYADMMLARSGMADLPETLDAFRRHVIAYEGNTGHLFQSVTQASWDVWAQGQGTGGPRNTNRIRKTISYYDKGPPLGLMLDFKIRHETKNKKSLDDVMRTLYQTYYKEKKRGWTEQEFRDVCEKIAGTRLSEFFEYVYTTKDPDYVKYFGYGGVEIEPPTETMKAYLGAIVEEKDAKLIITALDEKSAASRAKLAVGDEIMQLDGASTTLAEFNTAISGKQSGEAVKLKIFRDGKERSLDIVLGGTLERSFKLKPVAKPTALQAAILKDWMAGVPGPASTQAKASK
jgi:predicted metalloprotease with PDZ domain